MMEQDNLGGGCCGRGWETPKGRGDEHNNKFFLSTKPSFNPPVGERHDF
jgi:hypothetical protein